MAGHGRPLARRIAAACAAALALTTSASAQPASAPPARSAVEEARRSADLHAVCWIDGQLICAVGDHGAIWHSADGGATWSPQESGVTERLLGVQFVDASRGWAVGGRYSPGFPASRGVVLRTDDGGRTWTCDRRLILPRLAGLRFDDAEHGIGWSEPSGVYPSGLLSTDDGGRSFSPLGGEALAARVSTVQGWIDGATVRRGVTALLRRDSQLALLRNGRPQTLLELPGESALRAIAPCGATALVVAGDDGALLRVDLIAARGDSGAAPVAIEAPPIDWRAACAVGDCIWLAGDPGSIVYRSVDAGRSWNALPTGHAAPLTALSFVDEQRGCAVGAGGVILVTADGGQTWRAARDGATCELLVVALEPSNAPWECLADERDKGAVVWCAANRVARDAAGSAETRAERFADALSALGSRGGGVFRLPLWPAEAGADGPRTTAVWDSLSDGDAQRALTERIATLVDAWRPHVLAAPAPEGQAASGLLGRSAEQVWKNAQSAEAPREGFHLARHRPRRWCVEVETAADKSPVSAGQAALAGSFVGAKAPASIVYQVRGGEGIGQSGSAALSLTPRAAGPSPVAADVAKRLRQLQAVQSFAERRQAAAADPGSLLESALAGLEASTAAELLAELAVGDSPSAEPACRLLSERFAEHPLAPLALWRLWRSEACWEQALLGAPAGNQAESIEQAADADRGQVAQVGSAVRIDDGAAARASDARQLLDRLERLHPEMAFEPVARASVAAWRRRRGPGEAVRRAAPAVGSTAGDRWAAWAKAEAWLDAPQGECPVESAVCRLDAARPKLDGNLDDATWRSLTPLALTSPWNDGDFPAEAFLAADEEHLFLAVRCRRAADTKYVEAAPSRERDADLSEFDRVTWRFDVDRDLTDGFELTVDQRGWGAERVTTGATWNPRWFIATRLDADQWTAEAAIPWRELRTRPTATDAWACRVERVAPGAGRQVWPADEEPSAVVPSAALLRFAAAGESSEPRRLIPGRARPIPLPDDSAVEPTAPLAEEEP